MPGFLEWTGGGVVQGDRLLGVCVIEKNLGRAVVAPAPVFSQTPVYSQAPMFSQQSRDPRGRNGGGGGGSIVGGGVVKNDPATQLLSSIFGQQTAVSASVSDLQLDSSQLQNLLASLGGR